VAAKIELPSTMAEITTRLARGAEYLVLNLIEASLHREPVPPKRRFNHRPEMGASFFCARQLKAIPSCNL
jgi:hypothetical protein